MGVTPSERDTVPENPFTLDSIILEFPLSPWLKL